MRSMLAKVLRDWGPPRMRDWMVRQFGAVRLISRWPASEIGGWIDAAQAAARGYDEGLRRVSAGKCIGFLPDEALPASSENSRQFHDRLVQLALVAARAASGKSELRVLDFGGGFGTHALALRRLLPGLRCHYTVAELPGFCDLGSQLNPRVAFVSGLEAAGVEYDLVYASSSVQYSPDWRKLAADLCRASAESLFVTRTPFVFDRPGFVTTQRAYKTEYPGWVLNYDEFVEEVTRHGFALSEVFLNGAGIPVRGVAKPNVHLGLLFERTGARRRDVRER